MKLLGMSHPVMIYGIIISIMVLKEFLSQFKKEELRAYQKEIQGMLIGKQELMKQVII